MNNSGRCYLNKREHIGLDKQVYYVSTFSIWY